MEYIPFNVTARTAMLIGRENVNNAKSAVIELVKNTYDADSDYCFVYFASEKSNKIDTLYIIDNGEGMNRNVIIEHWMTIGTDNKQYQFVTENGRIKSGAKGIGRFALDRLGSAATMITRQEYDKTYIWKVDWSSFESGKKNINDVKAGLDVSSGKIFKDEISNILRNIRQKDRPYFFKKQMEHGTIIKITDFRDTWEEKHVEEIYRTLNTLIPPSNISDFRLYMKSDSVNDKYGRIIGEVADDFDYRIIGEFIYDDSIRISIERNEFDYEKFPEKVTNSVEFLSDKLLGKKYFTDEPIVYEKKVSELMGIKMIDFDLSKILKGFKCEIIFLKRGQSSNDRDKYCTKDISNKKRSDWLNLYGGIKLFRDNFKVRPYGEVETDGFDWLNLSSRAEKSPAAPSHLKSMWRVRSNQIQGIVNISRTTNQLFKDQANREGIQDSDEFLFFKSLLRNIIKEFETDRQKVYRILAREHEENITGKKEKGTQIASLVKKEASKSKNVDEQKVILAETVSIINEENEDLRDEIRTLQALATTGLIINTLSHEIKDSRVLINKRINKSIEILRNSEVNIQNWNRLKSHINIINSKYISLNEMFTMTLDVIKKDKRKRKAGSLRTFILDLKKSWRAILNLRNIDFHVEFESDLEQYKLKFFVSDLETILNNLIINSIEAFEDESLQVEQREVKLRIEEDDDYYIFKYSDNGPGLSNSISDIEVFTPHETTKINQRTGESVGTGLGMWIVSSIVSEYNGICTLKRRQKGFYMEYTIKKNLRRKKSV